MRQKRRAYILNKILLFKRVEHIVAKGEVAHLEQFLLLQQCFRRASTAGCLIIGENAF